MLAAVAALFAGARRILNRSKHIGRAVIRDPAEQHAQGPGDRRGHLDPGGRDLAARTARSRRSGRRCTSSASRAPTGASSAAARSGSSASSTPRPSASSACCSARSCCSRSRRPSTRWTRRAASCAGASRRACSCRRRGRGRGYLEIDVQRHPPGSDGRAILHVEVEVANFYPSLASGIGNWFYANTQSRIHVIVTHGFLRSLARLDLAESRVGRFATLDEVPGPADAAARAGQRRLSDEARHVVALRGCPRRSPSARPRAGRPAPARCRPARRARPAGARARSARRRGRRCRSRRRCRARARRPARATTRSVGQSPASGSAPGSGPIALISRAPAADTWIGGGWPAEST